MTEERERFFSRLATIPGIRTMPSIGSWILIQVENPAELARKINRRAEPGTVNVPRNVANAVRIPVRDPKSNESLFQVIRDVCFKSLRRRYYRELCRPAIATE